MVSSKNSLNEAVTDVFLFTTEVLPENMVIRGLFPMIEVHGSILISKKSLLKRVFTRNKNQADELFKSFMETAPKDANAVIGVRTSTTTAMFSDGTYLMVTHSGTPAIIEKIEEGE